MKRTVVLHWTLGTIRAKNEAMKSVRRLFLIAVASAGAFVSFPAHSLSSGATYFLVKIWETPLDSDSFGMLVAACPDGSAYVISINGTFRWISPDGVPSPRSAKVSSYENLLYAVCDAKRSLYLAGTHLRILDAGPGGVASLVGDALASELVVRVAVLPDGSIWVKYALPSKAQRKSPSFEHFSHDGKHFPKTDPVLTQSQVQALPGVIWSESHDTKKNEQEFRLSGGATITQSIVESDVADAFKRLILTIHDPASPDAPSIIESDNDGVLSSVAGSDSLFFLYRENGKSVLRRFHLVEERGNTAGAPSPQ